jgi:hypothetical protein
MALAGNTWAQPAVQSEPATPRFLEKRVPDELATEGVVLSRRNLALQIERLADKWLVSLVNLTTGRVAASTKVDALPADREAAVAAMTHVVAELATQTVDHGEPVVSPPPAAAAPAGPGPVAELAYKRRSIRFGAAYAITGSQTTASLSRAWVIYQGDLDEELKPVAFYTAVGRPELGEQYMGRRNKMIGGFVVAGLGVAADAAVLGIGREDANVAGLVIANLAAFGGILYGIYYSNHLHPIEENDAKALADAYNQRLRRELGLPVVARRRLLHDVQLTPYLAGAEAGVGLRASF